MGTTPIHPGLEQARPTPKAFVSYSWETDEHRDWVRELAARLRGDGVDVTLDRWELQPGDQLPTFMERAVRENDYVLIVCTPHYKRRSNERLTA
jgi:nucleotide-binding universal stress UspA family protein